MMSFALPSLLQHWPLDATRLEFLHVLLAQIPYSSVRATCGDFGDIDDPVPDSLRYPTDLHEKLPNPTRQGH